MAGINHKDGNGSNKVLLSFEKSFLRHIDRQALAECRNRSELIREACRHYIGLVEKPETVIKPTAFKYPSLRADKGVQRANKA